MGRATSVLILLLALAPTGLAQTLHEDFSRAEDDLRVLRVSAARVLAFSTEALDLSLASRHGQAAAEAGFAADLSLAMGQAARLGSRSATSTAPLAPLADAAGALSGNATLLAEDWRAWQDLVRGGFAGRADALRGELLLGSMRQAAQGGLDAADAYGRLGFDVAALRATLERFRLALEAQRLPPPDPDEDPSLFLEAFPDEVVITRPLHLRGVLLGDEPVAGRTLRLLVDGEAWAEATTDARGFFSTRRVAGASLGVGAHEARALAATAEGDLVSNAAPFTLTPLPTRLLLSLPGARLLPNATVPLAARLVDVDGAPVAGRVALSVDGAAVGALDLDASGAGSLPLRIALLALGPHEARAAFAGDAVHAPSDALLAFEVAPPAPARGGVAGPWTLLALLALAAVAALGGVAVARRRKGPPAPPAPLAASEARPPAPEAGISAAAQADDPLEDLLALHRALLARLAAEGLDVRPLTHREVAGALRARRYPEEPVRALTQALERALYAGRPPRAEEIAPMRAAFAGVAP